MKTVKQILIGIAIVAAIVLVIYLLRNTKVGHSLWVVLSALFSGLLIIGKKFKQLFTPEQSDTIESLKTRLDQTEQVEKELIDLLMKEREVFKEKLARLETEGAQIDTAIDEQEEALANYSDLETWEKEVWNKKTDQEKQDYENEVFGKEIPLETFEYHYSDM